jgi:serine/threonine-protein kinase
MRNLDNGDPNKYVEYAFGWRNPQSLSSWRGAQYFGQDGDEGGQRYRVELMAVDLSAAESARAAGTAAENALAGQGIVLAARNVRRAPGTVANDCVGP